MQANKNDDSNHQLLHIPRNISGNNDKIGRTALEILFAVNMLILMNIIGEVVRIYFTLFAL